MKSWWLNLTNFYDGRDGGCRPGFEFFLPFAVSHLTALDIKSA